MVLKPKTNGWSHASVLIILFVGIVVGATAVNGLAGTNNVWHALVDISTAPNGTTSVDADADGIIDLAENAAAVTDGIITSAKITDATIAAVDVDPTQLQLRVAGTCAVGNAVRVVNQDGTVTCEAIPAASADGKDVKVTSADTTASYLNTKLQAGSNITLTVNNPGANETLTIASSTPAATYAVQTGSTTANGTATAVATCTGGQTKLVGCSMRFLNNGTQSAVMEQYAQPTLPSTCTAYTRIQAAATSITVTAYALCSS